MYRYLSPTSRDFDVVGSKLGPKLCLFVCLFVFCNLPNCLQCTVRVKKILSQPLVSQSIVTSHKNILDSMWTGIFYFSGCGFSFIGICKGRKLDVKPLVSQILVKMRLLCKQCSGPARNLLDLHQCNLLLTSSGQCSEDDGDHRLPRYSSIVSIRTKIRI